RREARGAALLRRLHEEATEPPPLVGGQELAVLGVETLTEARIEQRADRRVLAVVDGPEARELAVCPFARRVAELRKEEPGLPLAADGGGEKRKVGNERHGAHPERGVRPVDELVEVGGSRAEVHRPVGRIVLARRE